MATKTGRLLWQIPLTALVCVVASLAVAWTVSRAMGFTMNPSVVAVLSAVLSAAAIGIELWGNRKSKTSPVA